jgi:hypothetical protein
MEQIIGSLVILGVIFYIVKAVLIFIYNCLVLISGNFIIAIDYIFGAWSVFSPPISWAVMGLLFGALLYFANMESHRLNRPAVKGGIVFTCILIGMVSLILGSESKILFARMTTLASSLTNTSATQVKTNPPTVQVKSNLPTTQVNTKPLNVTSILTISLVPGSDCLCNAASGVFDSTYQGKKIFVTFAHSPTKANPVDNTIKVFSGGNEIKDGWNLLCPKAGESKISITGMNVEATGTWYDQTRFEATKISFAGAPKTKPKKRKASSTSQKPKDTEKEEVSKP